MQFPFHVGNVDTTKIPDGLGTVNVSLDIDTILPIRFTPGPFEPLYFWSHPS